jgi:Peptidase family M48
VSLIGVRPKYQYDRGGLEGRTSINPCPPTEDYPLFFLADRLFSLNDTSREDDPAGQNCTLFGAVAQNKTPRTRFESQGAQSISPPPSAAQPQNTAPSGPNEWHRGASASTLRPYRDGSLCLSLYPLAAGHFRERWTNLKVHWFVPPPPVQPRVVLGQAPLILILGGLWAAFTAAPYTLPWCCSWWRGLTLLLAARKRRSLLRPLICRQTLESDFQFAAKQREQLGSQKEVPDDIAGRVGEDVFESLVKNEMISDFRLPYTWTFRPYDRPDVNAFSLADGEVVALAGLSRLIGTNRGLWAAVLAHEIAHVDLQRGIIDPYPPPML